jgi:pimeloyl-ACP methyl ester carboxylesterase
VKNSRLTPFFPILFLSLQFSLHAQSGGVTYFTSFDQTKIHYEVMGSGKPVLLIHGFTGSGNDWKNKPLADSLIADGFKVITVDLRGNGLSDKPRVPEAYADNAEAKDLIGLIGYLGIPEYAAVGYSRGSIILASLMVLDKRCKLAVIGGMGADFTNPQWPRRIGFYNALMNDTIKGYEGFRKYIAGKGLDPIVLACQQKEQPSTSKEALAKLTLPVLIVCGNEDSDNGKGSDLQKLIPNSIFVEVKGTHNTSAYTVGFAEKVLSFLKG